MSGGRSPRRRVWVEEERHPLTGAIAGMLLVSALVLLLFAFGVFPVSGWWLVVGLPVGGVLGWLAAYTVPTRPV